jgi:hypothetical protein
MSCHALQGGCDVTAQVPRVQIGDAAAAHRSRFHPELPAESDCAVTLGTIEVLGLPQDFSLGQ